MKKKIVFIVNHAAFFVSHRLLLAKEIIKRGWDFHLIVGNPASKKMEVHALREEKIRLNLLQQTLKVIFP